jgi:hypothetical protein
MASSGFGVLAGDGRLTDAGHGEPRSCSGGCRNLSKIAARRRVPPGKWRARGEAAQLWLTLSALGATGEPRRGS